MYEHADIVEYCSLYIRKLEVLETTHLLSPPCPSGLIHFNVGNLAASKYLFLIYHNECIFHANKRQLLVWAEEGKVPIHPKTQRRGIMVSDFVTEHDGLLNLSDDEHKKAPETNAAISQCASELIKYGAAGDGYWNNKKFVKQVKKAVTIEYPTDKFNLV